MIEFCSHVAFKNKRMLRRIREEADGVAMHLHAPIAEPKNTEEIPKFVKAWNDLSDLARTPPKREAAIIFSQGAPLSIAGPGGVGQNHKGPTAATLAKLKRAFAKYGHRLVNVAQKGKGSCQIGFMSDGARLYNYLVKSGMILKNLSDMYSNVVALVPPGLAFIAHCNLPGGANWRATVSTASSLVGCDAQSVHAGLATSSVSEFREYNRASEQLLSRLLGAHFGDDAATILQTVVDRIRSELLCAEYLRRQDEAAGVARMREILEDPKCQFQHGVGAAAEAYTHCCFYVALNATISQVYKHMKIAEDGLTAGDVDPLSTHALVEMARAVCQMSGGGAQAEKREMTENFARFRADAPIAYDLDALSIADKFQHNYEAFTQRVTVEAYDAAAGAAVVAHTLTGMTATLRELIDIRCRQPLPTSPSLCPDVAAKILECLQTPEVCPDLAAMRAISEQYCATRAAFHSCELSPENAEKETLRLTEQRNSLALRIIQKHLRALHRHFGGTLDVVRDVWEYAIAWQDIGEDFDDKAAAAAFAKTSVSLLAQSPVSISGRQTASWERILEAMNCGLGFPHTTMFCMPWATDSDYGDDYPLTSLPNLVASLAGVLRGVVHKPCKRKR